MTVTTAYQASEPIHFDFALLRKAFRYFALTLVVVAPITRDPFVVMACGVMPWMVLGLIDRPRMPAVVVYYLLYLWLEAAARVLLTWLDNEALGDGMYGQELYRAFWYSMASLVVLAIALRLCLGTLPVPSPAQLYAHRRWPLRTLFYLYLGAVPLAALMTPLSYALGSSLSQPVMALASLKYVIIFMLFATALSTGTGSRLIVVVLVIEMVIGFTGLFSGFKSVFIALLVAALSLRIPLRLSNLVGGAAAVGLLVISTLFWTAVKQDYREFATGFSSTQGITASFTDRAGLLVERAVHPGDIDWSTAADGTLRRLAYIDFFGAVIGIAESAPEPVAFARWRDALEHVAKPRVFFPQKAALDDNEIFLRYVRGEVSEEARVGTSISVGYLAENFIDFGFPGMLIPIAALGLLLGLILRYFVTRSIPWAVGEGFVVAIILNFSSGMELSLAKYLGASLLPFAVFALFIKFIYPSIGRWLSPRG